MRMLALLLLPAFIGLVSSQQGHGQGHNFPDKGRSPGGSSAGKKYDFGQHAYPNHGHLVNQVNHGNVGAAPQNTGQSSRGLSPDFNPAPQLPISSNVNHAQVGAAPPPGGNSGLQEVPLGPVQTGMTDQVNMVNAGAPPANNGNSGEVFYGPGPGAAGQANNVPAPNAGNQVAYAGGSSGGGNAPAFAGAANSDNTGQNSPLGGAEISDLTQQEAYKSGHVSAAAGVGSTVAGVVVAVLVLVGIVGVAAVFLVRQRQSRMTIASV